MADVSQREPQHAEYPEPEEIRDEADIAELHDVGPLAPEDGDRAQPGHLVPGGAHDPARVSSGPRGPRQGNAAGGLRIPEAKRRVDTKAMRQLRQLIVAI